MGFLPSGGRQTPGRMTVKDFHNIPPEQLESKSRVSFSSWHDRRSRFSSIRSQFWGTNLFSLGDRWRSSTKAGNEPTLQNIFYLKDYLTVIVPAGYFRLSNSLRNDNICPTGFLHQLTLYIYLVIVKLQP